MAVAALTIIAGCGNSIPELLQAPQASKTVSVAGRHEPLSYRIGGLQAEPRGETGAIAAPLSDGDTNCTRPASTARVRNLTAPGPGLRSAKSCKKDTSLKGLRKQKNEPGVR